MHALTLDEVHGLVKTRPQVDTCLQLAVQFRTCLGTSVLLGWLAWLLPLCCYLFC